MGYSCSVLNYLETYLESRIITLFPPYVRMTPHIAEKNLFQYLLERREGVLPAHPLILDCINYVERTSYDSLIRRLNFVLATKTAAASWHSKMIMYRGSIFYALSF